MDINNVTLIGRLTKDPDTRYSADGKAIAKIGVAVNGYKKEDVNFITCTAFGL